MDRSEQAYHDFYHKTKASVTLDEWKAIWGFIEKRLTQPAASSADYEVAMTTKTDITLPPLPEAIFISDHQGDGEYFEADDMQNYARAAVESTLADHNRLVRELDVLLNGEDGAAPQASLCDIVAQVQREGLRSKWHERHHGQHAASAGSIPEDALGRLYTGKATSGDQMLAWHALQAVPVAQEPVAWANWKVGTTSYVPYRTEAEARASVRQSEIAATQDGPYMVVPLGVIAAPVAQEPTGASSPGPVDAAFNAWYESEFKPAMERGPLDKYVARQAWFAALRDALPAAPVTQAAIERVVAERDALREALDELANGYAGNRWDIGLVQRLKKARAALAQEQGGSATMQLLPELEQSHDD